MEGSRFDAWTRRRFGFAGGGLAAFLLGVAPLAETEAGKKKKRKKKRCKKLGTICRRSKQCCGKLRCDNHGVNSLDQTFCCKTEGKSCANGNDCCSPLSCFLGTCEPET